MTRFSFRAVRPVKMTSSTSTTVIPSTEKGTWVPMTTGASAMVLKSSRYRVMSSSPTGMSTPSSREMFLPQLLSQGDPTGFDAQLQAEVVAAVVFFP